MVLGESGTVFKAVMYEQYGDWSFVSSFKNDHEIVRFIEDFKRPDYRHVKWPTVILVPLEVNTESRSYDEGVWVCVFTRKDEWVITSDLKSWSKAKAHADARLLTERDIERGIGNVTIRCIPYPEAYDGVR